MKKKYYLMTGVLAILVFFIVRFCIIQSSFIQIPITIIPSGSPAIFAVVENQTCLLKFDSGSKFQMSLKRDLIESIHNKKANGLAKWRDAKGNFYESPSYILPRVELGDLVLTDAIVKQEDDTCKVNTTLWNDNQDETPSSNRLLGTLGRPLLEKTNVLLDFQNLTLIACNDKKRLKKAGFFLDHMVQIPFEGGAPGIIIKVKTDAGALRLGLDTGTTITLVRASRLQDQKCTKDKRGFLIFNSQQFLIGNKDFGCKNLFLYDITPELHEIDGILGMDFLEKYVIYIDYKDKVVYIGDSNCKMQDVQKM